MAFSSLLPVASASAIEALKGSVQRHIVYFCLSCEEMIIAVSVKEMQSKRVQKLKL